MKKRRIISLLLVFAMAFTLQPVAGYAANEESVYITLSEDGQFYSDKDGKPVVYREVSLADVASIDLSSYGLDEYAYDANNDGTPDITALQLYIYVHENIMGESWDDVSITGSAGSIYFAGGLFGFEDENLMYYYNGAYPEIEPGLGATADQIVLSDGDFFDVAHYSSWSFYSDPAAGFHYFVDSSNNVTHQYTAQAGAPTSIKLERAGGGMFGDGDTVTFESGYPIKYGKSIGTELGTVTTGESGSASITFDNAGTYYVWCDGAEGIDDGVGDIVSSPASAAVIVSGDTDDSEDSAAYQPILNNTLAQLAVTVDNPTFGTGGGEWSVLSLARGGYFATDDPYFETYYSNVEKTVPGLAETAAGKGVKEGGLDKNKSTENSRLILALAAIGKDPTNVGGVNVLGAYDANGFTWIKKQGINGPIFTLIALDTKNYPTKSISEDGKTIREQCVDFILSKELANGGWALSGTAADPDITSMALQALVKYKDQKAVAEAADRAFTVLSNMQKENGGFASWGSVNSESIAQVITALSAWGIDADKDSRFVKDGGSALDALLTFYIPEGKGFAHVLASGGGYTGGEVNGMATDQASYALVAYDRFVNGKASLYDMVDVGATYVTPTVTGTTATVSLPADTTVEKNKPLNFRAVSGAEVDKAEITIPAAVMEKIGDAEKAELQTDLGTIVFDKDALAQMQSASDVTISMASKENDNGSTTFTLTANDKNGTNVFASGNSGSASISVKFKAPADGNQINVYYIDGETRTLVPSKYENQKLTFTVGHFSEYEAVEEEAIISATLSLPEKIENIAGSAFNAVVNLNGFPKDCRLLDCILTIPDGVSVTDVTMGSRIGGGEVSWHVEEETGKLRIVYFDAGNGNVMTKSGTTYPLELMTIGLKLEKAMDADSVNMVISGMSMKKTSDSKTQTIINTASATDTVKLVKGISFSAMTLYTGDDIDLIPASKTAIAVAVTGIEKGSKLTYNDGTDSISMLYNAAISEKTGVSTYIAMIDSGKALDGFIDSANYTFDTGNADTLTFGDTNSDGIINAQDALNTVNYWLRKIEAPKDNEILAANVTGDSRINTFDALGIVECFVDGSEFAIVNYAATVNNAVN